MVHFGLCWSYSVHLCPFWTIRSIQLISVHFGPFRSISIYISLFRSIQSVSIHFCSFWSTLVHFSPNLHFGPFSSFRSTSVHFSPIQFTLVHFGPLQSLSVHFGWILSISVPIRVSWNTKWSNPIITSIWDPLIGNSSFKDFFFTSIRALTFSSCGRLIIGDIRSKDEGFNIHVLPHIFHTTPSAYSPSTTFFNYPTCIKLLFRCVRSITMYMVKSK